ncbi:MAG: hypothetical protein ABSA79_02520, partial [Candidatus Bathyarchaeia archaeon]
MTEVSELFGETLAPEPDIFGSKAETESKSSPDGNVGSSPLCPRCGGKKVWRDSKRYSKLGDEIQRWYCRECGRRFSDPNDVAKARNTLEPLERIDSKALKTSDAIVTNSQICVMETKNLVAEPQRNRFLRRNETVQLQASANIPEKVVNYLLWLKKQGYAESTIFDRVKIIKFLAKNSN